MTYCVDPCIEAKIRIEPYPQCYYYLDRARLDAVYMKKLIIIDTRYLVMGASDKNVDQRGSPDAIPNLSQ